MKKFIVLFGFVFILFGFNSTVFAEDIIDITPPTGTILINNGDLYTNNINVTLTLSATDDISGVSEMKIANYNSYDEWEPYSTTKAWTISNSEIVRVKFKDLAGNETVTGIPATITLDTIIPVITLIGESTVNLNVGDSYIDAGVTSSDDIGGDITSSVIKGGTYIDTSIAGTYTITYNVSDLAGNNAEQVTRNIIVNNISTPTPTPTESTTNIHLEIKNKDTYLYNNDILVSPCNSDNDINTPDIISPYCAILQLQPQITSDWSWYGSGAFVNSINSVAGYTSKDKDGNDVYHYWSWFLNGGYGETGLNQYELKDNDLILLDFVDPIEEIPEVVIPKPSHSSGGGSSTSYNKVNINKALEYLSSKQNSDGSFNSDLYTDWAGIAFASTNTNLPAKEKIINYLKNNSLNSSVITDNERHAMVLMSLGIDPYSGTKINYIKKITDSFDGAQFGDPNLVNDDIFALIVLKNAGYTINDEIIIKDINYIISKQSGGSWGNVDMTSAGLQALRGFKNIIGVSDVILKSENYLISNQNTDLGFGNSFSTSWVLQSMFNNNQILKSENYLASKQQTDGGLGNITDDTNTRIWATSYVIPAVMNKSWEDIMQSFPKPSNEEEILKPIIKTTIEDKKNIEISKINIDEPDIVQNSSELVSEIPTENNLGASAGNAVSTGTMQAIINFIVNIFAYIGKGFYSLIIFLKNLI